jgi:simple sugar transport system ATP-binding protein
VQAGTITLDGADITHKEIRERIEAGLGHIPEDRQKHGLISEFTISENFAVKSYYLPPLSSKHGILNFR